MTRFLGVQFRPVPGSHTTFSCNFFINSDCPEIGDDDRPSKRIHGTHQTGKMAVTIEGNQPLNQCLFLVPVKGGLGGIVHPPIGRKNTTYILPSGGLHATYHLLGEPETTIDLTFTESLFVTLGLLHHGNP